MLEIFKRIGENGQYLYGYADECGTEVIEAQFDYARPFTDGVAFVEDNTLWKVIDAEGRPVGSNLFGHIVWDSFSEGLYVACEPHDVNRRGKCGFINQRGEWIIKPNYLRACPFKDGYAKVMTSSREWVQINKKGDIII